MRKDLCIYPGSFDPVTFGHIDLIERAAKLFPRVLVAVLVNPMKTGRFPADARIGMLKRACAHLPAVDFDAFNGLLVDYLRQKNAVIVLRGLRTTADFEIEAQMAQINRQIAPETETLFIMTAPQYTHVSSSMVREIAEFGGDISSLVPGVILEEVMARLKQSV